VRPIQNRNVHRIKENSDSRTAKTQFHCVQLNDSIKMKSKDTCGTIQNMMDLIFKRNQENSRTGEKQKGNKCGKTEGIPLCIQQPNQIKMIPGSRRGRGRYQ
jgi:DNA replication protein DnaD